MKRLAYATSMAALLVAATVVGVWMVHDAHAIGPVHVGVPDVNVRLSGYSPNAIEVKAGTTVTWTFVDGVEHDVTGDDGLHSPLLAHGTYDHTFTTAGTYEYHCSVHPIMRGRVIVTTS